MVARINSAWRGDWATLWRDMEGAAARRPGSARTNGDRTLEEQARQVESLLQDGQVSKAVALARGALTTLVSVGAATALRALFPEGELPDLGRWAPAAVTPEFRAKLEAAVAHGIIHFPRRKGPGPNGSRFEHWGSLAADADSL
eukprot:12401124-Karenia_brevis.AAC.1